MRSPATFARAKILHGWRHYHCRAARTTEGARDNSAANSRTVLRLPGQDEIGPDFRQRMEDKTTQMQARVRQLQAAVHRACARRDKAGRDRSCASDCARASAAARERPRSSSTPPAVAGKNRRSRSRPPRSETSPHPVRTRPAPFRRAPRKGAAGAASGKAKIRSRAVVRQRSRSPRLAPSAMPALICRKLPVAWSFSPCRCLSRERRRRLYNPRTFSML